MRRQAWRWILGLLVFAVVRGGGTAGADMVYFKNGTSLWAEAADVEGDEVAVFRGGHTVRFPKADVERIEKKRTNLPDYHVNVPPPPPVPEPSVVVPAPGGSPGGSGTSPSGSSGSRGSRRY